MPLSRRSSPTEKPVATGRLTSLDGLRGLDVVEARGHGLFLGVQLDSRERARAVKEGLKARGVLISTDGPNEDVLKIKPPLVLSAEDCDCFLEALCDVL